MRKAHFVSLFVFQLLLVACSSGDDVAGKSDDEVANPLLGKWELVSVQDDQGKVQAVPEGTHSYVSFFQDKMTLDGLITENKLVTITVLGYAVEDGSVVVTTEDVGIKKGEQVTIPVQLLEGDKAKMEMGGTFNLRRVGAVSSENSMEDSSSTGRGWIDVPGPLGANCTYKSVENFSGRGNMMASGYCMVLQKQATGKARCDGDRVQVQCR